VHAQSHLSLEHGHKFITAIFLSDHNLLYAFQILAFSTIYDNFSHIFTVPKDKLKTRMWADAQRDGHPAVYRWHPLQKFHNSTACTMPQTLADATARVPCGNTANIVERKTWTQSEFCSCQNSVNYRAKAPKNAYTHWTIKNVTFYFWIQLWLMLTDSYSFYIILIVNKFYIWR